MKEIQTIRRWKNPNAHGLAGYSENSLITKSYLQIQYNSHKSQMILFTELEKNSKIHMEVQNTTISQEQS